MGLIQERRKGIEQRGRPLVARTFDVHAAVGRVLRGGGDDGDGHGHLLQPHVPRAPEVIVVGRAAPRGPAPMQPKKGWKKMKSSLGPKPPDRQDASACLPWLWAGEGSIHQLGIGHWEIFESVEDQRGNGILGWLAKDKIRPKALLSRYHPL